MSRIPREDPLGRELLYLPSPEMLKLVSLGNPGLVADILYLWSIQYYSQFRPEERFLYLETIYDLITDLDPLYFDAYRIGALIMQIQVGGDDAGLQRAVKRLFDKGLRNLPQSWALAEAAAWDMFIRFRDRGAALHYAEIAAERPGAPPRLKRMVGVWRDRESSWTVNDSVEYWRRAVDDAEDEYDRKMCLSHLYDAVVAKDRQRLDQVLRAYATRFGRCAASWGNTIDAGLLGQIPLDFFGNPYEIDRERCTIVAHKKIRDQ
ncbi:MAG: hypothetical protein ACC742_16335 [Thermoanaerobaculales bacterium]